MLSRAEREFDVMITTDSNIPFQQDLARYDLALIVLRAYKNELPRYLPLAPTILDAIEQLEPGQSIYLYGDEQLRKTDEQKGRKK